MENLCFSINKVYERDLTVSMFYDVIYAHMASSKSLCSRPMPHWPVAACGCHSLWRPSWASAPHSGWCPSPQPEDLHCNSQLQQKWKQKQTAGPRYKISIPNSGETSYSYQTGKSLVHVIFSVRNQYWILHLVAKNPKLMEKLILFPVWSLCLNVNISSQTWLWRFWAVLPWW